jgi:hypothetical protein
MYTKRGYLSFLLRMWSVREADRMQWRVVLKRVDTGEERSFGNLEQLFACLRQLAQGVESKQGQ